MQKVLACVVFIVVFWSITGGKRSISMNGNEIQYEVGKRSNANRRADILEAAWRLGGHVYQLKFYAYKPSAGSPEKRNAKVNDHARLECGKALHPKERRSAACDR